MRTINPSSPAAKRPGWREAARVARQTGGPPIGDPAMTTASRTARPPTAGVPGWLLVAASIGLIGCYSGLPSSSIDTDGGPEGSEDDEGAQPPAPEVEPLVPRSGGLRRLSRAELDATLRDLLLDDTAPATRRLPEENIPIEFAFDNDANANGPASESYVEAVEGMVTEAVQSALANADAREALVPCVPAGVTDTDCMSRFVASFGLRALRRPLEPEEQARYEEFSRFAESADDFYKGVEAAARAILTGPEFIYRVEVGEPVAGDRDLYRLSPYEIATRLSYTLTGTTPDAALLQAAADGALDDEDGARATAARLWDDPRARDRVHHFHAYWLGYQSTMSPSLAPAFREETHALLDDVIFDEPRDYFEVFASDRTYIGDELREHYADLEAPSTGRAGWVSYEDSGRRGLLSHGSVLSAFRAGALTSPTKRGLFIRLRLLCERIPEPPPEVNVDVGPEDNECSLGPDGFYERVHRAESCAACHDLMDPIGFGLEQYDVNGRLRDHEDDRPQCGIDGAGAILADLDDDGRQERTEFRGPRGLSELLVSAPAVSSCLVRHVYRFSTGRMEDAATDADNVERLRERFEAAGRDLSTLMIDAVASSQFLFRRDREDG